eukprot:gene29538-7758_t
MLEITGYATFLVLQLLTTTTKGAPAIAIMSNPHHPHHPLRNQYDQADQDTLSTASAQARSAREDALEFSYQLTFQGVGCIDNRFGEAQTSCKNRFSNAKNTKRQVFVLTGSRAELAPCSTECSKHADCLGIY